jgi:sulfite reductase beta subunit-like hemoprotein
MADTAVSKVEAIKATSNHLRGTIGEELSDGTPAFSPECQQLLRFHGIYQQDDRDVRTERKRQGLDVDHICMVRVSIPGGILTPEQYLAMDTLCDAVASGTLRITSRQGIQYHFVRKGDLHSLLATLNHHLVTTLGACGDVVRNIMCCPAPLSDRQRADVGAYAQEAARRFRPRTHAYYQLWLDGERAVTAVEPGEAPGEEPLYGTHLPAPEVQDRLRLSRRQLHRRLQQRHRRRARARRRVTSRLHGAGRRGHGQEPRQPRHLPPLGRPPHDGGSRGAVGGAGHHHPRVTRPRRPPRP